MIGLIVPITLLYLLLIAAFFRGWSNMPSFSTPSKIPENIKVSVLIPFRNEALNLEPLICSLKYQSYPLHLTEIIFIDDHSSDNSQNIILNNNRPEFKIIALPPGISGKKAALLEGSKVASGELLITSDADCLFKQHWLSTLVHFYLTCKPAMIVAPVILKQGKSLFSKFQYLEFLSLQGSAAGAISIGHPVMCNGANLAFSKEVWPLVQKTYSNTETASGDDIFALLTVKKKFPGQVRYLKSLEATVETSSSQTVKDFLGQRTRWTSKARYYKDFSILLTAFIVLGMNMLLVFLLFNAIIHNHWLPFLSVLLIKSLIDFPFLFSLTSFFKSNQLLKWFPVIQCFYLFYVTITFVCSLSGKYSWKERNLRN